MSITPPDTKPPAIAGELAPEDFYMDGPYVVFTAAYHLKRGSCCKSGCRHCPYKEGESCGGESRVRGYNLNNHHG